MIRVFFLMLMTGILGTVTIMHVSNKRISQDLMNTKAGNIYVETWDGYINAMTGEFHSGVELKDIKIKDPK